MEWINTFMDKFYTFWGKVSPVFAAIGRFFKSLGEIFYKIGLYMYWLRSLLLAAPIAAVALILAMDNRERLTETVQITKITYNPEAADALFGFLELGTATISRDTAVFGPALITAACLLMMMCSKRTLYPFMISVFSLCLPLVIWFFNVYPM
jgi:hypothetical protein